MLSALVPPKNKFLGPALLSLPVSGFSKGLSKSVLAFYMRQKCLRKTFSLRFTDLFQKLAEQTVTKAARRLMANGDFNALLLMSVNVAS